MKKHLFIVIVFLSSPVCSYAAPIGNPTLLLNAQETAISLRYDSVERDLEEFDVEFEAESTRILLELAYGISDQVVIYGRGGVGDAETESFDGSSEPAWGGGIKFVFSGSDQVDAGITLQIMWFESEDEFFDPTFGSVTETAKFTEMEAALGVSFKGAQNFVPYVGVHLSKIDGDDEVEVSGVTLSEDFEEADTVGVFVGGDFIIDSKRSFNLEGRFGNETSFALGFTIRF